VPIADITGVTPHTGVVVAVNDTVPVIRITAIDQDSQPVDLDAITVMCVLRDLANDIPTMELAATTNGQVGEVTVPWSPEVVDAEHRYSTSFRFTEADDVRTVSGPPAVVYDPSALWVDPAVIANMTGNVYTEAQVVGSILIAQGVVQGYVGTPIVPPIPANIAMATTLLAARGLTAGGAGTVDTAQIIAESIGDYSVRYAAPNAAGSAWLIAPGSDIADLLAPWNPSAFDVFVGPKVEAGLYPVTYEPLVVALPVEVDTVEQVPSTVNLIGYVGDTLTVRVNFSDPEFATGTWAAEIKQVKSGPALAAFDIDVGIFDAVLTLDAATTDALGAFKGYWDIQVILPTQTVTIVQGTVTLQQDVTD